jgi:brefeldin A-resistance guanine nucleotide exchange factor 1
MRNWVAAHELTGRALQGDALILALSAIRQLAEARSTLRLARRKGSLERSETGSPRRTGFEGQLAYDPACVFLLEMMVSVGCRGRESVGDTW